MENTDNNNKNASPFEWNFEIDSLPEKYQSEKVYLLEWFKGDGEWIEEGQPLYKIRVGEFLGFMAYSSNRLTAKKTGIVEHCKKEGDEVSNGDIIYKIHSIGGYKNENIPDNNIYRSLFNRYNYQIPEKYAHHQLKIKDWHKKDGDFVKAGELVLTLKYKTAYGNNETINHYSERDGFIEVDDFLFSFSVDLKQFDVLYTIYSNNTVRTDKKFKNEPLIIIDDFTKKKIIKWQKVAGNLLIRGIKSYSAQGEEELLFSFMNENGLDYIIFNFLSKHFVLSKGDKICFLFEEKGIIEFVIQDSSYKISDSSSGKIFENKALITDNELLIFEKDKFVKWRISFGNQKRELIGGDRSIKPYLDKSNLVLAINKLAKEHRELVRLEIDGYVPVLNREELNIEKDNSPNEEECYVYLMIDIVNNHYKIGISNKPEWRERTLQSEKPTIELVAKKKFVKRKIALSIEKALHQAYSNKRIRGEWFQLDEIEVEEIKSTLLY